MDRFGHELLGAGGEEQAGLVAEGQPDAAVRGADGAGAHPHHLAGGAQRVEVGRLVLGQPGAEHVALEHRGQERRALQLGHHLDEGVDPAPVGPDALPAGRKRARATASTGSTSRRSAASERRRSWRSTSSSHHSRSTPSGRNSPRTTRPSAEQGLEHGPDRFAASPNRRRRAG